MPPVKKYVKLKIKQKCEIIEKLKKGESVASICKAYSINKSTVCRIKKQECHLKKFITMTECGPGNRVTLKRGEYPKMENALNKWFVRQRENNAPISGELLKEKARSLHKQIKEKPGDFNASNGWFKNFKKRFGIRYLKVCGEKLTNKPHLIQPFKEELKKIISDLGLVADQIYNADESGLFYRLLPDHTFVTSSEKSAPGRKIQKERITFLPCANATGDHKLKLIVIGKAANPRALKNFHKNPVTYRNNCNAWMTLRLFNEWFQNTFVPEVKDYLRSKGLPIKALLLIDNATCHPQDGQLQSDDGLITTKCIPPNCTALIQPMDQNIIKLVKSNYKKSFLRDLICTEGSDLNLKLKNYNLRQAITNLASAWEKVPSSAIQKSWKYLMAEKFSWDEEDELPLSSIRENIIQENSAVALLLQDISGQNNISFSEINQWITEDSARPYGSEDRNENEIDNEKEDDDENIDEETNFIDQNVKLDDAIKAINTSLQWACEHERPNSEILVLKNLREAAMSEKINKPKFQSKISNFFKN